MKKVPRYISGRHSSSAPVITWLLIAAWATGEAQAQSEDDERAPGFFVEVEGGVEYDSVVSLDELDLSSGEGDTALLVDAAIGYTQPIGNSTEIDLSYEYSVLDYQEFSEVDQTSHILSADLKTDVGKADIGLAGFYVNSDLDDQAFLELARVSPYVSGFFRQGWFARAGVVYSDKTNDINPDRDATAAIGEVDLYHFPPGKAWFLNVGYKYRDEDASAPRFDYQGNTYKARYVHRLTLWEKQARFELSYRYLDRDYSSVTPSIGEERFDKRQRTSASLEISLTPRVDTEFYYTYSDWASNLQSVNFDQDVIGLRVRYRWER